MKPEMKDTNRNKVLLILQTVCCVLLAAVLAAGSVCIYLEGSAKKSENPLESIYTAENAGGALAAAAPFFLAALCLLIVCLVLGVKDPKAEKPEAVNGPVKPKPALKHSGLIRTAVAAAAALLIIAGILNGSAWDMLVKAITICTECIGLG